MGPILAAYQCMYLITTTSVVPNRGVTALHPSVLFAILKGAAS